MDFSCPNCGGNLSFRSAAAVYCTCPYCQSTIVRQDEHIQLFGQVSAVIGDMSPFQVGTSGKYNGKGFTLVGRVKAIYDAGTWSEWYALMDSGEEAWLAEAQGFYMFSMERKGVPVLASQSYHVDAVFEFDGKKWRVDDIREVRYGFTEGELPFLFVPNQKCTSIDLSTPEGGFANIVFSPNGHKVYVGEYIAFADFSFQLLRELDGWKLS